MGNRAYALAAGLFVALFAALLIAAAFWLTGGSFKGVPYDLITERSVAGLAPGAPIRLRGVEIGRIQSIGFVPDDRRLVRVRALVDPRVPLMVGTYATIASLGLSGSDYVELNYPDSSSRTLMTSPDAPARIPMRPSGLSELTDSGNQLLQTFNGTLKRVDAVLTPQTAQQQSQLLVRLNAAAAQMTDLGRDLQPATRRLDGFVADADSTVRSMRATMQDTDSLVVQVRAREGVLDTLGEGARDAGQAARGVEQALVNETLPHMDEMSERLSRNSDTLEQLLQEIKQQPQSVIFGLPPATPGPGEPGFRAVRR